MGQGQDYRHYNLDKSSLGCFKIGHKIRGNAGDVQVSPITVLLTPVTGTPECSHPQDVEFYNRFPWSRSIPGVKQTMLNFSEISQQGSSRVAQYQLIQRVLIAKAITELRTFFKSSTPLSQQCYPSCHPRRNS